MFKRLKTYLNTTPMVNLSRWFENEIGFDKKS